MSDLTPIGEIIRPKLLKELAPLRAKAASAIRARLIDTAAASQDDAGVLYGHTVLCQTCLPHRDPGELRTWERINGNVHLLLKAGYAHDPKSDYSVPVGLPYGAKSRLVLMYIHQKAILTQSSRIEVEGSLTSFVHHVLGLAPHGRNIKLVEEQLLRLARAEISFSTVLRFPSGSTRVTTKDVKIISGYSLWATGKLNERASWPSTVDLSQEYFQSLMEHAVPLNENHIAALAHNALALDIYAWLAQRLHHIPVERPGFVSWAALHSQFGATYTGKFALRDFRADFRTALRQVLALYKDARIEDEEAPPARLIAVSGSKVWRSQSPKGLTLYNSPSPVPPKVLIVPS